MKRKLLFGSVLISLMFTLGCESEEMVPDTSNDDNGEAVIDNGGNDNPPQDNQTPVVDPTDDDVPIPPIENDCQLRFNEEFLLGVNYEHIRLLEHGLSAQVLVNADEVDGFQYTTFYYGPHSEGGSAFKDLGELNFEKTNSIAVPLPGIYTATATDFDNTKTIQSDPIQIHGWYYDFGITPLTIDNEPFKARKDFASISRDPFINEGEVERYQIRIGNDIADTSNYQDYQIVIFWRRPLDEGIYFQNNLSNINQFDATVPGSNFTLWETTLPFEERDNFSDPDLRFDFNDDYEYPENSFVEISFSDKLNELDYDEWVDENGEERGDYILPDDTPQFGARIDFNTPKLVLNFNNFKVMGLERDANGNLERITRTLNGSVIVAYF